MPIESDALKKLWNANENLIEKIEGAFSQYFVDSPGRKFNEWEYLVASALHLNLHRFKGIQLLLNPQNDKNFYMEGASLARNLFENWATLAWLNHSNESIRAERIFQFKNTSIVSQARINEALEFNGEESDDQNWLRQESQDIQTKFPKQAWKTPSIEAQVKEVFSRDARFNGMTGLYYGTVYRDLSQYVHLSYRTIREMRRELHSGEIILSLPPRVGFKCIDTAAGFFIFTAEIWNEVLEAVEEPIFKRWAENWFSIQTETRKELSE